MEQLLAKREEAEKEEPFDHFKPLTAEQLSEVCRWKGHAFSTHDAPSLEAESEGGWGVNLQGQATAA